MVFLEKYKKQETQNGHTFYTTTVNFLMKISPVHNLKSKLRNMLFPPVCPKGQTLYFGINSWFGPGLLSALPKA